MFFESAADSNEEYVRSLGPPAANGILDLEVLKTFERVKSDDGSDIVIELIDLYLSSSPQRIQEIRNAAVIKEGPLLSRIAHTLKGSSSTLGLRRITRLCQQLEDAEVDSDSLNDLVESLESEFVEARQALTAERTRRVESRLS